MNESGGSDIFDISGYNNTGTFTVAPTWAPGRVGSSLNFNGTNQYINAGTMANVPSPLLKGFSVSLWYKWTATGSSYSTMISKCSNTQNQGWVIGGGNTARCFGVTAPSVASVAYSTTAATVGIWYHGVITWDTSNNVVVYTNGVNVASANYTSMTTPAGLALFIGANDDAGAALWFPGYLDDIRIFGRALSAQDVVMLYQTNYEEFTPAKRNYKKYKNPSSAVTSITSVFYDDFTPMTISLM